MEEQVKKYKICNYSSYENDYENNHVVEGTNWSSIVSHLIDITAKKVDYYKSDIIYDVRNFTDAVDEGEDYEAYLIFRECGVTTMIEGVSDFNNNEELLKEKYIYRLSYDADIQTQFLTRVYFRFERNF